MNKNEEILNGQVNHTLTEGNGEQLIYRENVEGTPFNIVGMEGKYFVALGQYRLSEWKDNPEELRDIIYEQEWDFLLNVMTALVHMVRKDEELQA